MVVSGSSYLSGHLESDNSGNNYVTFTGDSRKWYRCPSQGESADINKGNGGDDLCIYYTRDGNTTDGKSAITTLDVVNETGLSGWTYAKLFKNSSITANGNTNEGTDGGTPTYIVYKSHTHAFANADYDTNNHKYWCAGCGYVSAYNAHDWKNTGSKISDATCDNAAVYYQKCSSCGRTNDAKHTYTTSALGHNFNANGICTRDASHFQEPTLSSGYYQIANYGNLCWFRDKVNSGSYTIKAMQTADITIPDGVTWGGIGHNTNTSKSFNGTYDGNCHTISGLKISLDHTAFINTTNKATIKNLGLLNVSVSGDMTAGLVRYTDNSTTISNCYVTGSAVSPLCRTNYGKSTITNCFAYVPNGDCLVASNYATITNCYTNLSKINDAGSGTASNCKTSVSASTFASGEIAYLLNGGVTDGTQVWYQKLGNGGNALPTLVKNTSNTVYKLENLKCDGVTKNGSVSYGNSSSAPVDAHNWTNTTTYSLSAADCTHDAVYYKACSVCNVKGSETWTATGTALGHGSTGYTPTYTWGGTYDDATCTFTLQCGSCGVEVFNDNITTSKVDANHKDATCTEPGNERWTATGYYSKTGDATYNGTAQTNDYTIPTSHHTFTNKTLTDDPVEDGLYAYACDYGCGTHTDDHIIKNYDGEGNNLELTKDGEGNYTAYSVDIVDGKSFFTPVPFTSKIVTMNRTFIVSHPSDDIVPATVMLPFSIEADALAPPAWMGVNLGQIFYEFNSIIRNAETGKWEAIMTRVPDDDVIQAYTPYILVMMNLDVNHLNFGWNYNTMTFSATPAASDMITTDAETGWTFVGLNETKRWEEGDQEIGKAYGLAGKDKDYDDYSVHRGDFVKIAAGASAKPGRCYLLKEGSLVSKAKGMTRAAAEEELPAVIQLRLIGNEDDITGIAELNTETGEMSEVQWYDLNGRKIDEPTKGGIYIKNNKKVLVK